MFESLTNMDIQTWVSTLGYAGVLAIVFLETGLFFGFFLPGDSLIFTAGLLAAKGVFDIWTLVISLVVTAALGYMFGYWFGAKLGHWLLRREDSFWFKKDYVTKAHKFYERYGPHALMLGRLVPILRTFVPIVAGMAEMPYKKYCIYNIIGAIIWGGGVTLAGYYIGTIIPDSGKYVLPVILLVILISISPAIIHFIRKYLKKKFKYSVDNNSQ